MDSFEFKGYWKIPNGNKTIAGTLKYDPAQGGILELLGTFEEISEIPNATERDIIHGFTPEGKQITLFKCIKTHTSLSQPGYFISKYYSAVIFIGMLFNSAQEITFKGIYVNFINLEEWLGLSFPDYKQNKSKKEHILKYKIPKVRKFTINNITFSIDFRLNLSTTRTHGTMRQTPFLKIEYQSEEHFDDFYKRIYDLQNFLTFSMNSAVLPVKVLGFNKETETSVQNQVIHKEIEILFRTYSPTEQKFNPYLILFDYNEISNSFGKIMKGWLKYAKEYQPIIDLYFGTFYQPEMYSVHRFLSLINSIEGYHRLRFGDKTELPVHKYSKMMQKILSGITSKAYKNWLTEKLRYSNELTLRKRIKETIRRIDFIPISSKGKQNLVDKIVITRNYYTHYDESLKSKAAKAQDLHSLNNKLNIMLQLCLMLDLKVPINQRVKENLQDIFN